jgi:hypothetical protein
MECLEERDGRLFGTLRPPFLSALEHCADIPTFELHLQCQTFSILSNDAQMDFCCEVDRAMQQHGSQLNFETNVVSGSL